MWDPKKRPTCAQALRYPYFQVGQNFPKPLQQQNQQQQQRLPQQRQQLQAQQQIKPVLQQERKDSIRSYFGSGNENKRVKPNAGVHNKTNVQGSGRKRWGEGVKDSTDEFESLLNEIDTNPVSYSKKVGVDLCILHVCLLFSKSILSIVKLSLANSKAP